MPQLFPRQSKSDEDYERFAFGLNPEPQTVRPTQQIEQKTSEDETEVPDLAEEQPQDGMYSASEQIYKTPVSADPGHLYFTG
jgi:hypothetical protein